MIGGRKVAIWLRGGRPFRKIDISDEDCERLLVPGGILGEVYMDACVFVAERPSRSVPQRPQKFLVDNACATMHKCTVEHRIDSKPFPQDVQVKMRRAT